MVGMWRGWWYFSVVCVGWQCGIAFYFFTRCCRTMPVPTLLAAELFGFRGFLVLSFSSSSSFFFLLMDNDITVEIFVGFMSVWHGVAVN